MPALTRATAPDAAAYVNLGRIPATPAAQAVAADVAGRLGPHLGGGRALGGAGRASLARDVGAVLAGVLRPGLKGDGVRAQRSPSGSLWQGTGAAMGRDRFWRLANALAGAGLVTVAKGIRTPGTARDGRGGVASVIRATPALAALAASHGATEATRKADWTTDKAQRATVPRGADLAVVTVQPLQGVAPGMTPDMDAMRAGLQANLAAVNAANARADIRGAGPGLVLVRRFRHSLAFGGRFYGPAYVTTAAEERLAITFDGAPAAELDLKASQLTLLHGLAGHPLPPGDPYAVPCIPRDVVKAWVVQSLGGGRPALQWADSTPKAVRAACAPRAVWDALRPRCPFLADLAALVPADALASLPAERHGWAAGQWLVQREAAIVARALGELAGSGIAALPVHDALLVPVPALDAARRALMAAFEGAVGIAPRLDVERLDSAGRVVKVDT